MPVYMNKYVCIYISLYLYIYTYIHIQEIDVRCEGWRSKFDDEKKVTDILRARIQMMQLDMVRMMMMMMMMMMMFS
jgi:hypothetical protein